MERRWITASTPRKGRTVWTVIGSIALHVSIIAVAALWPVRPATPVLADPGITTIETAPPPGDAALELPRTFTGLPPVEEAAPQPPSEEPPAQMPPPEEAISMELAPSKPAPKSALGRTHASHPSPPAVTHGGPGTPGVAGAAGAGSSGAVVQWKKPQPPYPPQARVARITGSGRVRITTDGAGRVVSASVEQSTGSAVLDAATTSYARAFWSGPPNASIVVPITYQLR